MVDNIALLHRLSTLVVLRTCPWGSTHNLAAVSLTILHHCFGLVLVVTIYVELFRQVLKHICQLTYFVDCLQKLLLKLVYVNFLVITLLWVFFLRRLCLSLVRHLPLLQIAEYLARLRDVIDRVNDLADLLVIGILALDFIFKVLLQGLVLHLDALNLALETSHHLLLLKKSSVHFIDLSAFVLLYVVHLSLNSIFALEKRLVLFL